MAPANVIFSKEQLQQVSAHGKINEFNLVGRKNDTKCKCEKCSMAKVRRHASKRTKYVDAPKKIGEHVSPDVKCVLYESCRALGGGERGHPGRGLGVSSGHLQAPARGTRRNGREGAAPSGPKTSRNGHFS